MTYSLNECQSAAAKAARGGGLDWGLAEDAGRAAAWLAAHGLPVLFSAALLRRGRFSAPREKEILSGALIPEDEKMLCPFLSGAFIADNMRAAPPQWRLVRAAHPLIIAAFAGYAAAPRRAFSATWAGAEIITDGAHVFAAARKGLSARCADMTISPAAMPDCPPPPAARRRIAPAEWRRLQTLAARTFMPSDPHSRAQDAGAPETD
ncbi:MAG: DUF3726 domain-containing protein [Gammaproteobacteria bacterium]